MQRAIREIETATTALRVRDAELQRLALDINALHLVVRSAAAELNRKSSI